MGEFGVVFQNEPVDVSEEFSKQENHYFVGDRVNEFDPESASGKICWKSLALKQRVSYHRSQSSSRTTGPGKTCRREGTRTTGCSHDGAAVVYLGDDQLDLFFGSPKVILSEYTALTGRADDGFELGEDPLGGRVKWRISTAP